jgi:hypothetical protein
MGTEPRVSLLLGKNALPLEPHPLSISTIFLKTEIMPESIYDE